MKLNLLFFLICSLLSLVGCVPQTSEVGDLFYGGTKLSTNLSTIQVSASQVNLGLGLDIVLNLKDAKGSRFILNPGEKILFSLSDGTSNGTFGTPLDMRDGTIKVRFTATSAGTPVKIVARVLGEVITDSNQTISVISSNFSYLNSYVTLSSPAVDSNQTVVATLHVRDQSNNPLTTGGLSVAFTAAGGQSTVHFSSVTDLGDGTYTSTVTGLTSGSATSISASILSSPIQSSPVPLIVNPGTPASIAIVSGDNQVSIVGTSLGSSLGVRVLDANANAVPGVTVDWTSSSGSLGSPSCTSQASGVCSNSLVQGTVSGPQTITATIHSTSFSKVFSVTALPGLLSSFSLTGVPASSVAGQSFGISVSPRDAYGNLITSYVGTVQFSSTDTNSPSLPSSYTFLATENGVHSFNISLKKVGPQTIQISDNAAGVVSTTPTPISVLPAAASQLSFSVGPSTTVAGASVGSLVVQALDSFGNLATNFTANIDLAISVNPGAGVLAGVTTVQASGGSSSFSGLTINKVGVGYVLTASSPGLSSVNSSAFSINASTPSSIAIQSGNSQSGNAGSVLGSSFVAIVKDVFGNVIPGAVVDWTSTSGSLSSTSTSTNAQGLSTTQLTLGSLVSTVTTTATVRSTGLSVNFTSTVTASTTIGSLDWNVPPVLSYTASNSTSMTSFSVKILDIYGNLMTSNNSSTVTLSLIQGSSTVTGTLTRTASSGIVVFNDIKYTKAEPILLKATENSSGNSYSVNSASVVVSAGAPALAQSSIRSSATQAQADGSSSAMIIVTLKDAFGNSVSGETVTLAASGVNNILNQPSVASDASGETTGSILSTASGTKNISIVAPAGFSSLSVPVIFIPVCCSVANSSISASSPVIANGTNSSTVSITVLDDYSNPVPNVVPSISASGTGNSYGVCTTTDASGNSTCTLRSTVAESKTVFISGPFLKTGGAVAFTHGPASQLAYFTQPSGGVAGNPWTTQGVVRVLDAQGNLVSTGVDSSAPIALSLLSGSGILSGTSSMPSVGGVANFVGRNLSINLVGNKVLRATKSDTTGSGGSASLTVDSTPLTITPAAGLALSVSGISSSVTAGSLQSFQVKALDGFGNVSTSYSGTVRITSTDSASTASANATLTNGEGTFTIVLKTAGTQTITATDTVSGSITGSSSSITVNSSVADHMLKVAGDSQSAAAGAVLPINPRIRVLDIYENPVAGVVINFSPGSGSSVGSPSVTTNAQGEASTPFTLKPTSGANTLTASAQSGLPGTPAALSFTQTGVAGAASTIATYSGNNQSSAAGSILGSSLVAIVKDSNGNPVSGAVVDWSTSGGSLGSSSSSSDSSGLATNTFSPATSAGTKPVTATIRGTSTSVNFTIVVTPAGIASSQSLITGLPMNLSAGSTATITMTIKDAYGNPIPNQSASFMSTGTNNTIFQVSSITDANGQLTGTLISTKAEVKTVSFSSPVALTGLNTTVTFNSDVATSFALTSLPTNFTAGSSQSALVRALDQYSNTVSSYTGTVRFSSTDTQAVLPSNYTFVLGDSGQRSFSGIVLKTAGTRSVTVTDTATSSITGVQSGITVSPALAGAISSPAAGTYISSLNVTSFPISGTCSVNGQTMNLTVSDGTTTLTQTLTCSGSLWSGAGMDLSSMVNGLVTFQLKDSYGNILASVGVTKDSQKPILTAGSFTITSNGGIVTSPNLSLQILGSDLGSGVGAFGFATQTTDCASSFSSVAWQNYSSGNNYNFLTTYSTGAKTICAWVRDLAGNVSEPSSIQGKDYQSVELNLSAPPVFAALSVTNGNSSGSNFGTTTIPSGEAMRVSFTLNSTNNLSTNPVSVYYSLGTNSPWILLSSSSSVGSPGTGKVTWTKTFTGANAPTSSFFLIRLVATDVFGNTSDIISSTINSGNWSQFAGNVSNGLGLSAAAVRIASHNGDFMKNQVGSNTFGKIFFTTNNLGITAIDPTTGALDTYIKLNTGSTETGVPGTVSSTTDIPTVYNMISDGDKLYLVSQNGKIYLVDTVTNYISVFAGGGSSGCGVGTATSCASFPLASLYVWRYASLTIDPDTKAIYFVNTCDPAVTGTGASTTNIKIQKIHQSGGVATSVEDFAGNCAVTSAPTAGAAMGVSLYNTSSLYRSNHSQLVFVPGTKALYFGGVGTTPLQKIINGQVYLSTFTAATGGTYLSSQNKVYYAKGGAVNSFTPTATAGFDETITPYIQSESLCTLASCRSDGVSVASAGVLTLSLFSLGGQLGLVDNSNTAVNFVRYRIVSGGINGTLQTIAGTDRFSGDGGQPNLAFLGYINRIVYKTETDSSGFNPGLYIQDAAASRLLKVEPDGSLITVAAGNGISGPGLSGAPFGPSNPIDIASSGSTNFNNLVLDNNGYFTYSGSLATGRIASTAGGTISYLLNKTGDIFSQAEGTTSTTPGWTNSAGLAGLVYDSAGNLYFGGGPSSAGPRKIMVRIASNGKFFTVIGNSTSASSADCGTSGCANSLSVLNPGGFDNTGNIYLGPFDQNFNSGAGRLLFSEGTKIRYVTAPASVNTSSTSTLGTLVNLSTVSPIAFTYTYTDESKTAIKELFYVSTTGKLYCYRVATGTNPNCSSSAPGTLLGPNFTNLTANTIAMDNNNNIYVNGSLRNSIYKYAIPVSNNMAGADLDNFDGTTGAWSSDNATHGSFVTNVTGTDGLGGSSGLAGKLTYSFNGSEFSVFTNPYTYGYSGTACAGRPGNPCVSAIRNAPPGLQARSISFWVKSTSRTEIHFRVIDSTGKYYDYQLVALDRNLSTGNGACSNCTNGWYKYTADLSFPDYVNGSTPAKPYTPPSFTQLGGDKTIAKFGILVKPIGLNPSYTLSLSGDVSVDMFKIQDQATISTISQSPISRTVAQLNLLTSSATKMPSYKTNYLDNFGICSAPKSVPTNSGYTWPSPMIDSNWTFPNLIQNANINMIRMDMFWHSIELVSGVYDYTARNNDLFVSRAIGAGLKLNMILDYNNPLYTTYNYGVVGGTNMGQWNNYVDSVINHYSPMYGDKVNFEVWNEPDLSYWPTANAEGVAGKDDGLLYSQLLANTATQIATTSTNNSFTAPYVLSAGVGGVRNTYIDKFMQTGSADTMKGVAYHPYTGFLFPEFAFNSGNDLYLQLQSYYSGKGLPTPDLWATEFGYGSSMFDEQGNYVHCSPSSGSCNPKSNGLSAGGREFQAIYVVREMLAHFTQGVYDLIYVLTDSAMIYGTHNSCTDNTTGQCNSDPKINQWVENNFGILESAYYGNDSLGAGDMTSKTFGFRPKPAYYAVKTLTTFLKSILGTANSANAPVFDGALNLGISQAYGLRFHDNNKKYVVLWSSAVNSSYKFYLPSAPTAVKRTCGSSPNGNFDDCSGDSANYVNPVGTDTGGTYIMVDRHPVYLTF